MKRVLPLLCAVLLSASTAAQVANLAFSAGSPEDQASQAITNEADATKRAAMWKDFVQKFASNPTAAAFGYLQIASQLQASGDLPGSLDAGEKAAVAVPNSFDVLMQVASTAQQSKTWSKLAEYASKGGVLYNSIGKQKPDGVSDADFASQSAQQRRQYQQQYDFFETAAYNAIAQETDAKARMAEIDAYTPAFPKSKFSESIAQLAIYSLSQMKDLAGIATFADKALAANPDSVGTLAIVSVAFVDDPSAAHQAKAIEYAKRAIELAKDKTDDSTLLSAGLAHSSLGQIMLRQDGLNAPKPGPRTPGAIVELRQASALLKANPAARAAALYYLGFACAKSAKLEEARSALTDAAAIQGPYQQYARDLLAKVNTRPAVKK